MRVPSNRRILTALTLACTLTAPAQKPQKQPRPYLQLRLEGLGFPGISPQFLDVGASMLSVHFVDDAHLLLTYSERTLVPRIPNDPDQGHDDRIVAAKLLELPSGRVLSETRWHMHDHARYLWPLGSGSFLVRIGDQLYTLSPALALQAHDLTNALRRSVFPARPLRPYSVSVSPDGALVTLQTVVRSATSTGQTIVVLGDTDSPLASTQGTKTFIDFFRVHPEGPALNVTPAGTLNSTTPFQLPVDADGLLWAHQTAHDTWAVTFDPFAPTAAKPLPAATLRSSCEPTLQMLSPSEFLALTCRGAADRTKLASFGLDGKETWEEDAGDFGVPAFAFAPSASRFAISHIIPAQVPVTAGQPGTPASQEIRIYQNASGDLLLRAETTPLIKSAENFDLSADGTLAVLVRNGALALYKLPPLTPQDRADIAEVAKYAPPAVTEGRVRLPRLTGSPAALPNTLAAQTTPTQPEAPTQPTPQQPPAASPPPSSDPAKSPSSAPPTNRHPHSNHLPVVRVLNAKGQPAGWPSRTEIVQIKPW